MFDCVLNPFCNRFALNERAFGKDGILNLTKFSFGRYFRCCKKGLSSKYLQKWYDSRAFHNIFRGNVK